MNQNQLKTKSYGWLFLEFLQVYELLDQQFKWNEEFVNYLTKNFKFLYFIDESWKNKLKDIVLFDCGDLG